MDFHLNKKARDLKKFGDRAVGSVLEANKLNDCAFLAPIRSLTVDIENVDAYLKPWKQEKPIFRVLSGGNDVGDQQQPSKNILMKGILNWAEGKVDYVRFADQHSQVLFSVGFPNDKQAIGEGNKRRTPLGKIKTQGVQIFRINQFADFSITKTGLEVIKLGDATESSAPYLRVVPRVSLLTKFANMTGVAFEKTSFQCKYMAIQKIANIRPIYGIIDNPIGYTVRFSGSVPYPEHQSKAIIIALTTLLVMVLGPVQPVEEFKDTSDD